MWSQQLSTPPADFPITGICFVSNPAKCPYGYTLIQLTQDTSADADLWKDSFFSRRVTRYFCLTRVYPLDFGRQNNVMVSMTVIGERDPIPQGFTALAKTLDSQELSLQKKTVCVKFVHRNSTNEGITDVILLGKSKRPPPGFTQVGDVNGIVICYKLGPVPKDTQDAPARPTPQPTTASSSSSASSTSYYGHNATMPNIQHRHTAVRSYDRQSSMGNNMGGMNEQVNMPYLVNPSIMNSTPVGHTDGAERPGWADIPFVLGSEFKKGMDKLSAFDIQNELQDKTIDDITHEYFNLYTFALEREYLSC